VVKKLDRVWLWTLLSLVWMGMIYALSDRPAGDYDGSNSWLSWLPFAGTVAHVGLYFVLSAFVLRALVLLRPVAEGLIAYSTVFVALVYGVLDEIHQKGVEGRASEAIDVVADVFGAVLVVVFWFLVKRYRAKSDERSSE
jgi:VanZ family protein